MENTALRQRTTSRCKTKHLLQKRLRPAFQGGLLHRSRKTTNSQSRLESLSKALRRLWRVSSLSAMPQLHQREHRRLSTHQKRLTRMNLPLRYRRVLDQFEFLVLLIHLLCDRQHHQSTVVWLHLLLTTECLCLGRWMMSIHFIHLVGFTCTTSTKWCP